jgi:hypothetical protein
MLEKLLGSSARAKVLGVALFQDGLHLREIARRAGVSPSEAARELALFVGMCLLKREMKGRQVFFYPDRKSPIYTEMRSLYLKTDGAFGILREALNGIATVRYAFIFGSMAGGKEVTGSDIDVMVIGDCDDDELSRRMFQAGGKISRAVNYIHWSWGDFRKKLRDGSPFLRDIVKKGVAWLEGDYDEFVGLVEGTPGKKGGA